MTDSPSVERQRKDAKSVKGITLRDGEEILIEAVISNAIFWKSLAVVVLAVLIGILAWQLGVFLLIVAAITAMIAATIKKFLFLALTDQRVFVRTGVIKIDTVQLRFETIESVEVQRTIVGQVLGYANVVITGMGNRFTIVPFVENADAFRDRLDEVLFEKNKASASANPKKQPPADEAKKTL